LKNTRCWTEINFSFFNEHWSSTSNIPDTVPDNKCMLQKSQEDSLQWFQITICHKISYVFPQNTHVEALNPTVAVFGD
jgi:hypothetical protein